MEKEELTEFWTALGRMLVAIIALAISLVFGGYVVMYLWNGIITPTFDLKELTLAQGVGLDIFVSFITAKIAPKNSDRSQAELYTTIIVTNLIYMAVGYVVMQFI